MSDDDNKLIAERRRKLAALRESGIAYPNDFERDALAGELHARFDGVDNAALEAETVRVSVAGRMMAKRVMGKASFARLRDGSGDIQLFVQRDALPDGVYAAFKGWDLGDIVGAGGTMFRTKTGELSVKVDSLRLLVKSLRPLPEKYHGLTDTETRYRMRYVDLIMSESSRQVFRVRSGMIRFMREFLEARGFLEVETPMMQPIPGGAVARPFVTHHNALDMDLYLRIAPELYLKRLVVGGLEKVYEINRNFRNEGLSTRHNPEFTMLELYQAYADFDDIMALTEAMIREMALAVLGTAVVELDGETFDLEPAFARLSMEAAVQAYNPQFDGTRLRDVSYLRERTGAAGLCVDESAGAGKLLTELFEATVEDRLRAPTFITGYPAEVSPLSRANDADPYLTDRFELFIGGREIANGFSELNDPDEQAARFRDQVEARAGGDDEAMYYDADYVRALEFGLPPTGGLGVGVDRLAMLFTGSPSIRDVLLFPQMRPESGND